MVVTALPCTAESGITQERTGSPSRCTVQAPHCASPQPKWGLLSLRLLRRAYKSGMFGSALTDTGLPSTTNLTVAMVAPRGAMRAVLRESCEFYACRPIGHRRKSACRKGNGYPLAQGVTPV